MSPLSDLSFTELQGAGGASLNASLKVDGVTHERQSNSGITDVLQGGTLNLKGTGSTTLQMTSDTSGIVDSVKGLVNAFQGAIQDLKTKTAYNNQQGQSGLLATSSALRGLAGELSQLLGTRINTGGTITLNTDTSTAALANHADEVKTLCAGKPGGTGLGTLLTDKLNNITQPSSGAIATEKQATQAQIDRLDTNIASTKACLDRRYDTLAWQFAALDKYAAKLQQQGDYLSNIITSLNNTKQS